MYLAYSILLTFGFLLMLPLFFLRREKYAAGFRQRLGNYPKFEHDGRPVIWLHCVSVGETNAARPLVDGLLETFPNHRIVVSTTTRTGQDLARKIFCEKADAIVYFPFDWKFSVRKALTNYKPSVVLLMETEIWPQFISEAKSIGALVAIVNGRLSERSVGRYSFVRPFIKRVLADVDLALMQGEGDARKIVSLGMEEEKVKATGNLKFDTSPDPNDADLAQILDLRFEISNGGPLIIAASTHEPEERFVLAAYCSAASGSLEKHPRLLIAPRHPERFDTVAKLIEEFRHDSSCEWPDYTFVRRSDSDSEANNKADVILLDSIGELRAVYPLAEIVFVGGSLIRHGGQSVLEPAAAGKAIVTGPYTHNFEEVVKVFLANKAVVQLSEAASEEAVVDGVFMTLSDLLEDAELRRELSRNAAAVMKANRGATQLSVNTLSELLK